MTTSQTNQATEWSCYVPMWDDANDEFHNGWLSYRTDDPYFVHLEIEDWHAPVVAPRDVLLDGLNERAECLSKPDRTALRIEPASDGRHVLLGITQETSCWACSAPPPTSSPGTRSASTSWCRPERRGSTGTP
ncbi:hypothetical protein ACFQ0B_64780 [Nonomuraea thailandensis]